MMKTLGCCWLSLVAVFDENTRRETAGPSGTSAMFHVEATSGTETKSLSRKRIDFMYWEHCTVTRGEAGLGFGFSVESGGFTCIAVVVSGSNCGRVAVKHTGSVTVPLSERNPPVSFGMHRLSLSCCERFL